MNELVIASNNEGKIREIRAVCGDLRLLTLKDIGFDQVIPEPFETFEQNALAKAEVIHRFTGGNVFSDDSGICINALGGAPGVHSAYFGGVPRSDEKNNRKLLAELAGATDRSAFYKAVICLIWQGQPYFFEGICEGQILEAPRGEGGFGYDPLFVPAGYGKSFAELPAEIKHQISHRSRALKKMSDFLKDRS